jgi:hypothetical protein
VSNEKTYHLINEYLRGNLQGRALDSFKAQLKDDPEFARQVAIQEQLIEAINQGRKRELKERLKQSSGPAYFQNQWGNRWTYASAAIVVFFVSAFFIVKYYFPEGADQQYATEETQQEPYLDTDTVLPEDSLVLAMEDENDLSQPERLDDMEIESDLDPQEAVRYQVELADEAPMAKSMRSEAQGNKAPAEDNIQTESLIQISNYSVRVISPDFYDEKAVQTEKADLQLKEAVDSAAAPSTEVAVEHKNMSVEFWSNPINFKGYRYENGRLKVYQIEQAGPLTFTELDNRLYLKMNGQHYFISKDGEDHKFVPVTNNTLLKVLNE